MLREGEERAFSEIGAPRSVGASSAGVRAGIRRGEAILFCPRVQTRGERRRDAVVGVGGVVNAWGSLPYMPVVVIGPSWRVWLGVTVRRERRYGTLGFLPSIFKVFVMARLSRFCGAVAGRGIYLSSSVPITSLAGSRDHFLEPFLGMADAVHFMDTVA